MNAALSFLSGSKGSITEETVPCQTIDFPNGGSLNVVSEALFGFVGVGFVGVGFVGVGFVAF
jgi:hypothetical protein